MYYPLLLITCSHMNHINKNLEDLIKEAFLVHRKKGDTFPFAFEYTTSIGTKLTLQVTDTKVDLNELHYSFNIDEESGSTQVYVGDLQES